MTATPGTTRDLVTETMDLDGVPVTLVDTAGIRETEDVVESEGVDRARRAGAVARLVVLVLDRSRPLDAEDRALLAQTAPADRVIVVNKVDLPAAWSADDPDAGDDPVVATSLRVPDGVAPVRGAIGARLLAGERWRDAPALTNVRHIDLVERARTALEQAASAAAEGATEELILADLADASAALGEVTGRRTPEDLLELIFARFCIGK